MVTGSKIPVVQVIGSHVYVDGKLCSPRRIRGLRPKIFTKNHVIKFNGDDGHDQCYVEWELWKGIRRSKDSKHFAKIVAFDAKNGFLIQERIRFKKGRIPDSAHKLVCDLAIKYDRWDIITGEFVSNWGVSTDGVPIIFDWGV